MGSIGRNDDEKDIGLLDGIINLLLIVHALGNIVEAATDSVALLSKAIAQVFGKL
jgi:hypothetical protein